MSRYVALLRGVNVGGNGKVPMPVLRQVFVDAGLSDVATLINSGNVVFTAPDAPSASDLEARIHQATGVSTRVQVISAPRLREILEAMPFEGDESRLLVTFMGEVPSVSVPTDLEPEQIHLGEHAVYQHLPDGVSQSKLKPAFWKQFPPESTGRNVRTVRRLLALLEG